MLIFNAFLLLPKTKSRANSLVSCRLFKMPLRSCDVTARNCMSKDYLHITFTIENPYQQNTETVHFDENGVSVYKMLPYPLRRFAPNGILSEKVDLVSLILY